MSEEALSQASGLENTGSVEQQATQVETPAAESQHVEQQNVLSDKEKGLLRDLERTRADLQREREYRQFIEESSQYRGNAPEQQNVDLNLNPEDPLFVGDAEKLIEAKANALLERRLNEIENERIKGELSLLADEARKDDVNFEKRMQYAVELVQRESLYQGAFDRARTAKDKLNVLEKIAQFHPLYTDELSKKSSVAPASNVTEALQKIAENSNKPPTLSGVNTMGSTERAWSQMTPEEYNREFRKVVEGY